MLQNKLIDIYHTIMLHPTVYNKSLQGITEGNLGELANTLKKFQQKKKLKKQILLSKIIRILKL